MKAGFTVKGGAKCNEPFLMVSNLVSTNEVVNRAFFQEKSVDILRLNPQMVGVWKIKYKA